jgi:hypothetical protein
VSEREHPETMAHTLISELGFDGAQAHAELAALRGTYFDLEDMEVYWLKIAAVVISIRKLPH